MKMSILKIATATALMFGSYAFGADLGEKDLGEISKAKNNMKFAREYHKKNLSVKGKISSFKINKTNSIIWIKVGEVFVGCYIAPNDTMYDYLEVLTMVTMKGKISNKTAEGNLLLFRGCTISK